MMDTKAINFYFFSLICSLLLISCQSRSDWQVSQIDATKEKFSSSRLFSKTEDPLHGMDVELIFNGTEIKSYLSVHSRLLVPSKENPSSVFVTLKAADKKETFLAYLLEGKQKCLLSQEGTEFLLSYLNTNREIIILLTGYRRSLSPRSFEKQYRAFTHPSSWEIPFQFKI